MWIRDSKRGARSLLAREGLCWLRVVYLRGKALNMVFGFQLSFARVGSYANFLITGRIFDYLKDTEGHSGLNALGWTLAIAGISTILSLFGAIILAFMDKRRSRILGQGLGEQEKVS